MHGRKFLEEEPYFRVTWLLAAAFPLNACNKNGLDSRGEEVPALVKDLFLKLPMSLSSRLLREVSTKLLSQFKKPPFEPEPYTS
jgi:hypothetical protein